MTYKNINKKKKYYFKNKNNNQMNNIKMNGKIIKMKKINKKIHKLNN